ncbi:Afadin and alpha-actinin-binding-domain-containing protein [Dimargaris cristalligena]|uniref:Afadin and alpha-actinin-binding-domain-containing protein n=1 Tax=Dimargaris cristalligena TaxID=215637 RepID=A0A4P9ZZQ9_9FUNG|nr:Afadin and alpha-actinin-binding-domain-containing protein [Dimargaris cristalligena]|eukprot:RKP38442.1 Afadin and alpha-actinin-binding-domain-containing protein [Dimargaris cristalligena]
MESLHFLNHELTAFGFPAPLRLVEGYDDENEQILRCVSALLQQRQRDMDYREEIDDKYRRLLSDQETLAQNVSKLRTELETAERNSDTSKSKLSISETMLKEVNEKHRSTKEELKSAKNNLQYSRSQYAHEVRKREQENLKVKDKMQRMVADKYKTGKIGMQLLNPIVKERNIGFGKSAGDKELVDIVLGNYEEREQELLDENEQLRQSLYELYSCVTDLLQTKSDKMDISIATASEDSDSQAGDRPAREPIVLPYELIKERMSTDMKQLVADLKGDWQTMHAHSQNQVDASLLVEKEEIIKQLNEQLDILNKKLAEYQGVIEEQTRVIKKAMLRPERPDSGLHTNPAFREVDPDLLQKDRDALEQQRAELDDERRKFTEAAILLGKEREELRKERDAFQEQKVALQATNILGNMPATPHYLKNLNLNESTPEILARIQSMQFDGPHGPVLTIPVHYQLTPTAVPGPQSGHRHPEPVVEEEEEDEVVAISPKSPTTKAAASTTPDAAPPGRPRRVSISETPLRSRSRSSVHSTTSATSPVKTSASYSRATGATLSTAAKRAGARRPSLVSVTGGGETNGPTSAKKVSIRSPVEIRRPAERGPCGKLSCSSNHHHKPSLAASLGRRPSSAAGHSTCSSINPDGDDDQEHGHDPSYDGPENSNGPRRTALNRRSSQADLGPSTGGSSTPGTPSTRTRFKTSRNVS